MSTFRMPSLGSDMEDGTLIEWLIQPGQPVHRGDIIAVVETEKGAIEIEIFEDGTLATQLVTIGTTVPVGAPLAEIVGGLAPAAATPAPAVLPQAPAPATAAAVPATALPAAAPPAAMPLPTATRGRSAAEHEPVQSLPSPAAAGARTSPAARKRAQEHGLDVAGLSGTGPDGAIVLADVDRAIATPLASQPAAAQRAGGIDLQEMRKAIGAAMARSKREIPHYYLRHTIDMKRAGQWLAERNAARPPAERLLTGVLLLRAVAIALRGMPEFNGFYRRGGDGTAGTDTGFHASTAIHVGTAIAIRGGGLVAPAIHDTDQLSVDALMQKLRDLVARVRAGRFRASELADPTITVTSLGERGVESLYGVIYPPQVAIVGFGKVVNRPWATVEGALAVHPVISVTLAADHRVSDGHRGALLLARIDTLLQSPETL